MKSNYAGYIMNKRIVFLATVLTLGVQNFCSNKPPISEPVGDSYKIVQSFVMTAILTTYYTIADSNELSQNVQDWNVDLLTIFNILWRTALYSVINYYQSIYIPDHQKTLPKTEIESIKKKLSYATTTAAMLTYNSRYSKVIVERFSEAKETLSHYMPESLASFFSGINIFVRNFAWFYTLSFWLQDVTYSWYEMLPRQQQFSNYVYEKTKSLILAHIIFSLIDILYKHSLVSIKHTIWQFIPMPSNTAIFRFDDCTSCYLGTNMFGKNGPLARGAYQLYKTLAFNKNDASYPTTIINTTPNYCGNNDELCGFNSATQLLEETYTNNTLANCPVTNY